MLTLNTDVIANVGTYLTDKEKLRLTVVCILMNRLKYIFTYDTKIYSAIIMKLPYFDNFENAIVTNKTDMYPKKAKKLYLNADVPNIPQCVTHLEFGNNFKKSIKNIFPSSVTHMTLADNFTGPI